MASPPPVISPTQKAGSPVSTCPKNAGSTAGPAGKGGNGSTQKQKTVPCDIKSITVSLTTPKGAVSLTGTTASASGVPLADVSKDINSLLQSHAVVIVYVAPAAKDGAAPTQTKSISEQDSESVKGEAKSSVTMKANCGQHPIRSRTPAILSTKSDNDASKKSLSVGTKDWSLQEVFKCIWGGGSFRDFVFGQRDEVTFGGSSCGWPGSGDPTGSLSGYARMVVADEWRMDFRWLQGFVFNFSRSSSKTKDYRDGTLVESSSKSSSTTLSGQDTKKTEQSSLKVSRDGKTLLGEDKYDDGTVSIDYKEKSWDGKQSMEADSRKMGFDDIGSSTSDKFKAMSDAHTKKAVKEGLAFTLTRNGKSMIDTDGWAETISSVESTLKTGLDVIQKLLWLLETGAKMGIPVSLTFKVDVVLKLLQGSNFLRAWPEALPVKQSGTYYIADYKTRFQFGVDMTLFSLSVSPSITLMAKLVHEWVASLSITIEGKFTGTAKGGFTVSDGDSPVDINFNGRVRASVKGTGEGTAVSCYVKIDGEISSGIVYTGTGRFDGLGIRDKKNKVVSDELAFQASARYGNKVWDFLGLGAEDPDWQWPADGPFIWLPKGKLNKQW